MIQMNVLLVAHIEENRAGMDQALQGEGYSLFHARSREEALRELGEQEIQIALVSSNLPEGDAHGLVRAMQEGPSRISLCRSCSSPKSRRMSK